MQPAQLALTGLTLAFPAVAATAQQCGSQQSTDFSSANLGNWRWGGPNEAVVASGGFSGAYLRSTDLDTFAPQLSTQGSSAFTGDYRAAQVTSLGVDLQSYAIDFPTSCGRPLSLLLENDNGTPGNFNDDVYVYFLLPLSVPCIDGLWHGYSVDVPSQSAVLPAGWAVDPNWTGTPDAAWNRVIGAVTRVRWFYGDPTFFFIFQMWTIGADNPRIGFAGGASAYCLSQRNSAQCQPRISSSGTASASSALPFVISSSDTLNQKAGLLFYGLAPQQTPYQGGTLCVAPPLRRSALQNSGGNPAGSDCSGSFALDFNARIQSGADPALVPGAWIYAQWWSRDPQSPSKTHFSNALQLRICP
jgi:hypothetical protein